jgi:hypothetical protein
MPKTKEFIFSELVDWCYKTTDEEESDKIFKLFCSIKFMCPDDRQQLERIFREKTAHKELDNSSPLRLFRHILIAHLEIKEWEKNTLDSPRLQVGRIGEIIFNAWRVSVLKDFKDMVRVVRVFQPLTGTSKEAFEHLAVCAQEIAEIDARCSGSKYSVTHLDYEIIKE